MKKVLPSHPGYWQKVSSWLGTGHTAEQCQLYNQKGVPEKIQQKSKNTKAKKGIRMISF